MHSNNVSVTILQVPVDSVLRPGLCHAKKTLHWSKVPLCRCREVQGTILSSKIKKCTLASYWLTPILLSFQSTATKYDVRAFPIYAFFRKGELLRMVGMYMHVHIVNIQKRVGLCLEIMHAVKDLISFHLCSIVHPASLHTYTHSSMVIIVNPWPQSSTSWSARKKGETGKLQSRGIEGVFQLGAN